MQHEKILESATALRSNHISFLSRPLLCKFASINRDGSPHITPAWFMLEHGKLVITTPEKTVKARNVARDPRVALLVDDGERYVMIKGVAVIANRDWHRDIEVMAVRYEGAEAAKKSLPELLKEKQVSIEITPEKVISQNV